MTRARGSRSGPGRYKGEAYEVPIAATIGSRAGGDLGVRGPRGPALHYLALITQLFGDQTTRRTFGPCALGPLGTVSPGLQPKRKERARRGAANGTCGGRGARYPVPLSEEAGAAADRSWTLFAEAAKFLEASVIPAARRRRRRHGRCRLCRPGGRAARNRFRVAAQWVRCAVSHAARARPGPATTRGPLANHAAPNDAHRPRGFPPRIESCEEHPRNSLGAIHKPRPSAKGWGARSSSGGRMESMAGVSDQALLQFVARVSGVSEVQVRVPMPNAAQPSPSPPIPGKGACPASGSTLHSPAFLHSSIFVTSTARRGAAGLTR